MHHTQLSSTLATAAPQRVELVRTGAGRTSRSFAAVPTNAPAPIRYYVRRMDVETGRNVPDTSLLYMLAVRAAQKQGTQPDGIYESVQVPLEGRTIECRVFAETEGI